MRPSSIPCGACGSQTLEKNFRGASVLVCQHCQRVTLSKSDFKTLLQGATASSFSHDPEPPLPTEATEELESPLANPMAPTELDQTQAGAIAIDEPAAGAFDLSAIAPGTPVGSQPRQVATHADFGSYANEEDAFDAELAAYQEAKSQRHMLVGIAVVVVLIVLVGVGVTAAGLGLAMTAPQDASSTEPAPALPVAGEEPEKAVPVEPAAPAPAEPQPAPAPAPAPKPEPAPEPAPRPAPTPAPPPKPAGPAALVNQGWSTFDRDPSRAEELFAQALVASPNHSDASYGYGYVLLKRGATAEAKPHLCRALANGDAQTAREIQALLSKHALTCE